MAAFILLLRPQSLSSVKNGLIRRVKIVTATSSNKSAAATADTLNLKGHVITSYHRDEGR